MPRKNQKTIAKILLIEDDEFLASMYRAKLEIENYEVVIATNGEAGLHMAEEKNPDLILLDIVLPKMNGFKVLKHLKTNKNLKKIPVILLTNLGQKEDVEKGLKLGADEYLIKAHFLPSEVISKINKMLS
ncbi:MAG: response regulator [Patescibacteria group bacterium]